MTLASLVRAVEHALEHHRAVQTVAQIETVCPRCHHGFEPEGFIVRVPPGAEVDVVLPSGLVGDPADNEVAS